MISPVDFRGMPGSLGRTGFKIIWYYYPSCATQKAKCMDIRSDPAFQVLRWECLDLRVLTVGQSSEKNISDDFLAAFTVDGVSSLTCPIHFQLFAGLSGNVHRSFGGRGIFAVIIAELRVFERNLLRQATLFAVLMPQQSQRDNASGKLAMDMLAIRDVTR